MDGDRAVHSGQPARPERKDDRRIISGILNVLTSVCRWRDCPGEYGPRTRVYNRFDRWSRRGFRRAMLASLAKRDRKCRIRHDKRRYGRSGGRWASAPLQT
ncbi:hypothetical protein MBUL_00745 [Methylobacterium bullatum]|uniref:Insertion element IS402-like domain-containing protein n=1 Tax=Methylobacterium bullatum TaxID=570505 RepID=A0A679J2T8_9HYPH|nr:hypothetical protein MBUL_00745 [Methylobacterium bullatum]